MRRSDIFRHCVSSFCFGIKPAPCLCRTDRIGEGKGKVDIRLEEFTLDKKAGHGKTWRLVTWTGTWRL